MGRILTRTTPVGELVPSCGGDLAYPAVEIRLKTDDGEEVLIGVIEYDKNKDTLNWLRWGSLVQDDEEPVVFRMTKAEVMRQLKARKEDRSCAK